MNDYQTILFLVIAICISSFALGGFVILLIDEVYGQLTEQDADKLSQYLTPEQIIALNKTIQRIDNMDNDSGSISGCGTECF